MTARSDDHHRFTKQQWRDRVLDSRRALAPGIRAARAADLTRHALTLAASTGGPVCAYLPVGTEPWSPEGVEQLRAAGHEVLLPVVPATPGPLDWASYTGPDSLAPGPIGLREPAGPRRGPGAVTGARLLLVPALAADRGGVRLGRGRGYYDRTLPLVAADVPIVVVVDDEELVDALPAEPYDHPVSAALLPRAGLTPLGKNG